MTATPGHPNPCKVLECGVEIRLGWRAGTLALLLVSCAALGKLLYLSVLPFPHLKNGDRNGMYLPQLLQMS